MEGFYRSTSHCQFLWLSTGENAAQDLQSRLNLLGANAEWGAKANGAIPGAQEQESLVKSSLHHGVTGSGVGRLAVFHQVHGHHQTQATDITNLRMLALQRQQSLPALLARCGRIVML